ncbi:MAG TPA: hypothetical protein PL110_05620 [Candidatus Eremiobacteraeota bacterium]|nr:MAG: hypothetical protein BWY64_00218 [bacterium ADurb.Bin363]HPZ07571.1 hypothetical protein [Candidatus Eremiobacteraeota bacterium]
MKKEKEKTPEEKYKIIKRSFILYTATAILTPFVAIFLALTDKTGEGLGNLLFLVILTEVYTIMRAIFDYEETKKMEKNLSTPFQ